MAFAEIEFKGIDASVGKLCRALSSKGLPHKIQYIYEVEGHTVTMYEERPAWKDPDKTTRQGIARFRLFRSRKEWKVYWMRQDLKWHEYDPDVSTATSLAPLVAVVSEDKWGAFFG